MNEQQQAATEVMEEWLSHPEELGKKPAKLEIAGEFDLHDLHYYIFKFKKSVLGSWKVAVCGGYEGDGLGHCGHIYSEMENYNPDTAEEKCIAMVEKIREYWMQQAGGQEEGSRGEAPAGGDFLGFVLLSTPEFDEGAFREAMKEDWGLECPDMPEDSKEEGKAVIFDVNGMMVTIGLMEIKVPDGEAEYWANSNFMTREQSLAAAEQHEAHLLVAVLGGESAPLEAGRLFVKAAASCLKADNALGIYDCGTVWLPEDYIESAMVMKEGGFPLADLVFIGLYQDEKGISGWTNGLSSFGKEELEIVDSSQPAAEVYDMLWNISAYVVQEGAVLRDGQTLGFSAEQKLPLELSTGIYVDGESIKVGF